MKHRSPQALLLALLGTAGILLPACHSSAPRGTWHAPQRTTTDDSHAPAARASGAIDRDGYRRDIRSGTLTAGYFDDSKDPDRFAQWAEQMSTLGPTRGFVDGFDKPAIQITIINEHGDTVHNATVYVNNTGQRRRIVSQSGSDGRITLLPDYDRLNSARLDLTISAPGVRPFRRSIDATPGESIDLVVEGARSELPHQLDLALIIDTTGSMQDELAFLQVEFRAIVERIAKRFPHVDQRWALVVYRDKGDAYVVRDYDLSSSLHRVITRLGEQEATGGGNYPEAVDAALASAADLRWRDASAKVAFLIGDAPPHVNRTDDAIAEAAKLRAQGVALYPVASSGVKAEAEHFFRAAALLTGGGYSFLTDDSGVGNPHADPHAAPGYSVQHLDDLIVRLVESELTGAPRSPRQRNTLREVPQDSQHQHKRVSDQQIEAWRERRDRLAELLRTTELSAKTTNAIKNEITMLDRQIKKATR